jgi:zinc protease
MKLKKQTPALSVFVFSLIFGAAAQPISVPAAEVYFERSDLLPLVYVTVAFRGGSSQDPSGKSGVSDIAAKLLLRGTKQKTKQQINLALDQMGANLAVETRAEFSALRGNVLAENLPAFLKLLEEVIAQPSFSASEFEKLKREQISSVSDDLSSDRNLVRLRFNQLFFGQHPYSRPSPGRLKDLQALTLQDVKAHYTRMVHPDRMLVLGTGDAQSDALESFDRSIRRYPWPETKIQPVPAFEGSPKTLKVVLIDKPERTQTHILIGQSGIPFNSPDLDALQIANFAFGGGSFQSRLLVELRVKRGWTYGAGSGFKFGSQPHSWTMMFFPKNGDTPPGVVEALKLIREFKEQGITAAEFDFAKQSMMNSAGFNFDTPAKRMENTLNERLFGLPTGYYRDFAKRLSGITLDQVNQAVKNFIQPDRMLVAIVATSSISKEPIATALKMPSSSIEVVDFKKE